MPVCVESEREASHLLGGFPEALGKAFRVRPLPHPECHLADDGFVVRLLSVVFSFHDEIRLVVELTTPVPYGTVCMTYETYRIFAEAIGIVPYFYITVGIDDPFGQIVPVSGNL